MKFRAYHKIDGFKHYGEIAAYMTMDGMWRIDDGKYKLSAADCGYVFQQANGEKDKNGVDVYEGDIIKVKRINRTRDNEYSNYHVASLKHVFGGDMLSELIDFEVVGNIFETPELIPEK